MLKSYRSDRKRRKKKKITVTWQKHLSFAQMSQTFMLRSKIIRMPPWWANLHPGKEGRREE